MLGMARPCLPSRLACEVPFVVVLMVFPAHFFILLFNEAGQAATWRAGPSPPPVWCTGWASCCAASSTWCSSWRSMGRPLPRSGAQGCVLRFSCVQCSLVVARGRAAGLVHLQLRVVLLVRSSLVADSGGKVVCAKTKHGSVGEMGWHGRVQCGIFVAVLFGGTSGAVERAISDGFSGETAVKEHGWDEAVSMRRRAGPSAAWRSSGPWSVVRTSCLPSVGMSPGFFWFMELAVEKSLVGLLQRPSWAVASAIFMTSSYFGPWRIMDLLPVRVVGTGLSFSYDRELFMAERLRYILPGPFGNGFSIFRELKLLLFSPTRAVSVAG